VGDKVAEGDTICFLESMKMENAILAPVAGIVTEIKVSPSQSVEGGEIICVIEY
jgi:biotin carboxyl carrier protein